MTLSPEIDDLLELRHRAHALGLASHHRVTSVLNGLYASVFRGQGMDFEETREYQEGDEIRNMDWRVTARTGMPHLKVFREERERAVIFCVDAGMHMDFGTRGTFKSVQAARACALLGWSASGNQDRVGALLFGNPKTGPQYFRPSRARQSLWRTLRALTQRPADEGTALEGTSRQPGSSPGAAAVRGSGSTPDAPLLDALDKLHRVTPTGGLIFLIGDMHHNPSHLQRALGRLRQRLDVVLMPVDDPADRELPDIGKVVFGGPGGQRVEVDTDNETGRRKYRESWELNRTALMTLAARLGVPVIPIPTNDEIHRVLVAGLRRQMKRQVVR